ncbi:metallo-beta-lactamase superfamily protein [Colletotrichum nymphaeae SA-01]|uniref:Metallo-beta-lactamase superfamily protein n=1 Tax=Colletotrichum nymphaeae SA-01 TaxID=1460502 RepID=A0A135UWR2_9PEZI|nr:metallo-beta-lactamase superfamily protein [Colletotrichum nymphaeae SA-01]
MRIRGFLRGVREAMYFLSKSMAVRLHAYQIPEEIKMHLQEQVMQVDSPGCRTRTRKGCSLSKPKGLGEDGDHFEEAVADVGELPERTGITESGYPFFTGMDYISRGLPMAQEPTIHEIFEPVTGTWQYIVADPSTKAAVIIDSVLDFDPAKNAISTQTADGLLNVVKENGYNVVNILETHVHADHLTASKYLQSRLREAQDGAAPKICIGRRIGVVQERFAEKYGISKDEYANAFDRLLDDDEVFEIGDLKAKAIHLPGHTPDHMGYMIGANVFAGDSLFNHDVGSARCDFPGGNARDLFASVRRLLDLPETTKIWTGHDYPPANRGPLAATEVAKQKLENKHLAQNVTEEDFVKWREERDSGLGEPRLMHWALQVNVRAGNMPSPTKAGDRLLHVPVKMQGVTW